MFTSRIKTFLFSQDFSLPFPQCYTAWPQRLWSYDLMALYKYVYYYYCYCYYCSCCCFFNATSILTSLLADANVICCYSVCFIVCVCVTLLRNILMACSCSCVSFSVLSLFVYVEILILDVAFLVETEHCISLKSHCISRYLGVGSLIGDEKIIRWGQYL